MEKAVRHWMLTAWEIDGRTVPRSGRAAGATTLRPAWKNSMHFCRFSPSGEADSALRPLPGPDGGPCF